MYKVEFKNWHNNWSYYLQPVYFDDFEESKAYADKYNTFEIEDIGNNFYLNKGCQTEVKDSDGKVVYIPSL